MTKQKIDKYNKSFLLDLIQLSAKYNQLEKLEAAKAAWLVTSLP